jgi:hypothetical protein
MSEKTASPVQVIAAASHPSHSVLAQLALS